MRRLYRFFGLPTNEGEVMEAEIAPSAMPAGRDIAGEHFHDLGEEKWRQFSAASAGLPSNAFRLVKPDEMHRLPLNALQQRCMQGDASVVDLPPLAHVDAQRGALARQLQEMAAGLGVGVFALDADDQLLLIPGVHDRVDTARHELGSPPLALLD